MYVCLFVCLFVNIWWWCTQGENPEKSLKKGCIPITGLESLKFPIIQLHLKVTKKRGFHKTSLNGECFWVRGFKLGPPIIFQGSHAGLLLDPRIFPRSTWWLNGPHLWCGIEWYLERSSKRLTFHFQFQYLYVQPNLIQIWKNMFLPIRFREFCLSQNQQAHVFWSLGSFARWPMMADDRRPRLNTCGHLVFGTLRDHKCI